MLSDTVAMIGCAPNFRDIGGLRSADGSQVANGRVFRSEAVLAPAEADAARLAAHGIRLVCDLRSEHERACAPNDWWRTQSAELMEFDITADIRGSAHLEAMIADPGEAGALELMRLTYRALPEAAAAHLARLFRRIADDHLPLVVHCTAGKDRTGVVVALLLSALGVPREAIYADYLESNARANQAVVAATRAIMVARLGRPVDEAVIQALCGVRPEYLDQCFAVIDSDYGGIDRYLTHAAGLDLALAGQVRRRLLD
jgi:protein-tyrosine phosphatase